MIGFALFLGGCALSTGKFYYTDGQVCAKTWSGVLGTGETEKALTKNNCVTLQFSTRDTGLSDNVTELGGKVAEGLAKGAVKGLIPVP